MRKTITAVLTVGLIAGAFAAPAADAAKKKKKKKAYTRVVSDTYNSPALGVATPAVSGGASICPGENIGCVEFPTTAKDKFVKIEVTDASGQKAGGYVSQGDTNGDGVGDLFGDFCGAHAGPVAITPGVPLKVSVYAGTCFDGSPSVVTTGEIKATFTSKPTL